MGVIEEYDYLNARVRGMSTALLRQEFFDQLLSTEGENLVVDSLLSSEYGEQLQEALSTQSGTEAISTALRRHVHEVFAKLERVAPPEPARLLHVQMNRWDIANVLAILRGIAAEAEHEEIMRAILPVGELHEAQLSELASEHELRAVANTLSTWNYTFAFAVHQGLQEQESLEHPDLLLLDTVINRAYFEWALDVLSRETPNDQVEVVREQLARQIDLVNVKAALDAVRLREHGNEPRAADPIDGGLLAKRTLHGLADHDNLEDAFEELEGTYFLEAVERGILAFGETRNLAVMERFLENVVIKAGAKLFRRDPLSIAVPLGFIWRQYNEFLNLRILVRGKHYQMPANAIREELLFV